ncbi:MAG: 16S rRNA (guanine(966)-N(2))-methyltransferase RsmD [Gammaproteobacteria bacterium]|nr:16S rRNA (guanine(966)-N(2))-methyltransferase RsmD [Gammaproteobacteria bacterium]MCP5137564.1 16S rRNA (guanine(966)-N(2))-methyltransferase RsmD [Gammaproteobacteria bacterium]
MGPRKPGQSGRASKGAGTLRIIAGEWRGRRVPILDRPGLRPTTDRVRETVFNWLQHILPGARVLDLFAGAGGLGFEAASRGAAEVVMIEQDVPATNHLRQVADLLRADNVEIVRSDALSWLRTANPPPFDVVFIDPPFNTELAEEALRTLRHGAYLKPQARLYLEHDAKRSIPIEPEWRVLRDQTAGQARYRLIEAIE